MLPVGFEPTISAGERPQTYALDCAAARTGITGMCVYMYVYIYIYIYICVCVRVCVCVCLTGKRIKELSYIKQSSQSFPQFKAIL